MYNRRRATTIVKPPRRVVEYGERSRWNKKGERSFRREKTILLADELPTIYLGSTPLVSGVYILVDVIKRNKVDE